MEQVAPAPALAHYICQQVSIAGTSTLLTAWSVSKHAMHTPLVPPWLLLLFDTIFFFIKVDVLKSLMHSFFQHVMQIPLVPPWLPLLSDTDSTFLLLTKPIWFWSMGEMTPFILPIWHICRCFSIWLGVGTSFDSMSTVTIIYIFQHAMHTSMAAPAF